MNQSVVIASDHAGFEMKQQLIKHLTAKGIEVKDLGTNSEDSVDYPEYGHKLAEAVISGKYNLGISICGSGNGINMTTNKHAGIRGAICWNEHITEMARRHNDANVCSLPARYIDVELAKKIVDIFLQTSFDGGRHATRIRKIDV